jgi:hypothetical protein
MIRDIYQAWLVGTWGSAADTYWHSFGQGEAWSRTVGQSLNTVERVCLNIAFLGPYMFEFGLATNRRCN